MARNRMPKAAPPALRRLTKATLADLVWELTAYAADSVDDLESRSAVIVDRMKFLQAPRADIRLAEEIQQAISKAARS